MIVVVTELSLPKSTLQVLYPICTTQNNTLLYIIDYQSVITCNYILYRKVVSGNTLLVLSRKAGIHQIPAFLLNSNILQQTIYFGQQ
ncbi:hypothetical protein SAMN06269250_0146 [Spirosoma fluviale]|uniref:Uncharacterized protein n=1 Tax=Spirosoma fluviale TaxID=1597977 RepID=A0A286GXG7_9BACT|nr:hypothetical protein SAMN06269250_0146 [Spirosoma fluviale]